MDKLLESVKELNNLLKEEPLVKEYFEVKKIYDESEDIAILKKQIALAKKEDKKEEYNILLHKYHTHPIVNNYLSLKDEVMELLMMVRKEIIK